MYCLPAIAQKDVNIDYGDYLITTCKTTMHVGAIHKWLSENSFWANGTSYTEVEIAFHSSFCAGVLFNGDQIGYARLVTDYVYFGYLRDVYIEESHRNKGLGKRMIEVMLSLNWVQRLKHIELSSRDAKSLYKKLGFESIGSLPNRMVFKG